MASHSEIQSAIIAIMTEKAEPNDLWSAEDLLAESKLKKYTKTQLSNSLTYAAEIGKIFKHKIKLKHGAGQFALQIPPADRYIVGAQLSTKTGRRKNQKASSKEIRVAFMEMQRAFTRLEDLVMPVIESAEEKDKALERLRNVM